MKSHWLWIGSWTEVNLCKYFFNFNGPECQALDNYITESPVAGLIWPRAEHAFLVLTDHKNLEYLRKVKRWSIFFNRFRFTLCYRPGSKNHKADALWHQFDPQTDDDTADFILPTSARLADSWIRVEWQVEETPSSLSCLPWTYCSQVLLSCLSSHLSCHPRVARTFCC